MKKLEKTLNIAPSEKSYQVLARGCKNLEDGLALLNEIKVRNFHFLSLRHVYIA